MVGLSGNLANFCPKQVCVRGNRGEGLGGHTSWEEQEERQQGKRWWWWWWLDWTPRGRASGFSAGAYKGRGRGGGEEEEELGQMRERGLFFPSTLHRARLS